MDIIHILKLSELSHEYKEKAVCLFVDCFYDMYSSITKEKDILEKLFLSAFDFSLVYVAINNDKVVGFMGVANNKSRTMHFDKIKCIELFGRIKGYIVFKQLGFLLEKPNVKMDKDLCIDYLATDRDFRGKGIATQLIDYAGKELGYETCYIEVLSNNTTAIRLYEHTGFIEYKRIHIPRFGSVSKMKKQLKSDS